MKLPLTGCLKGRLVGPKLYRHISSSQEKVKCSTDEVKSGSGSGKFREIVDRFENLMEKHTPTAFDVYKSGSILSIGIKSLWAEFRIFRRVRKNLKAGQPLSDFSRKELEIYYRIPNDIAHVTPVLVIASIPIFGYWIVFPLLYIFPKQLLSPQFWTSRQLRYCEVNRHLNRVQYHNSVLWHLERSNVSNRDLKAQCLELVNTLRSGKQPTTREILNVKPLFQYEGDLAFHNLSYRHQRALSLSHGLKYGGLMAVRASRRFGGLLWEMDRALARESIAQLTDDDLQQCCFMRGFNPVALSRSEAEKYLDRWLQVSLELQDREYSLLLHAPIFLAYNHKNNFGRTFL